MIRRALLSAAVILGLTFGPALPAALSDDQALMGATNSQPVSGGGSLSAPVALGTCALATAVNTCIITVTSTCAAGSAIWVAAGVRANSASITGIADSQSNSWTFETEVSLPSVLYGSRSMHALNTAHTLTSGTDTITVTFSTASAVNKVAAARCIASAGGTFGTDTGTTATGSTIPVVIPSPSYALTADTIVSGIATVTATSYPAVGSRNGSSDHWSFPEFVDRLLHFECD